MQGQGIVAREGRGAKRGTILIAAIIVMIAMLIMAIPFLFKLSVQQRTSEKGFRSVSALFLAEAGVERAIWELNYGSWAGKEDLTSNLTMAINDIAAYNGQILGDSGIKVMPFNYDDSTRVVETSGSLRHIGSSYVIRTVKVILEKTLGEPLFTWALFADEGITLDSNALIDSYDSRIGKYGDGNTGSDGNIATNATESGSIILGSNASVSGDATAGEGSDPDTAITTLSNSKIIGDRLALPEELDLPFVPPPAGLPNCGIFWIGSDDHETISQSGQYSSFVMDSNAQVTITADVSLYITGDFSLLSNAKLYIAAGASAEIWVGGNIKLDSNTILGNLSQDPTKLLIYGTETAEYAEWNSNNAFYGAVYMPATYIENNSNAQIYGAFVGRYYYQSSNAQIHYDNRLSAVMRPGSGKYKVKSWHDMSAVS